jgi:branched-chain amino acid transport system permease protein
VLVASILGAAFAALFLPFLLSTYDKEILVLFVINVMLVLGYRTITTMGGWSFAHTAIMGLGSYTMAILTQEEFGVSFWLTLPLAAVAAGIFSALLSYPVLRTRGFYFFLSTFAAGEALRQSYKQFTGITGGTYGISFIPRPESILGVSFESTISYYYLVLIFTIVIAIMLIMFNGSRFGRTITAVAQNEELSLSIGINTRRYRMIAFVLGSAIAGVAGVFFANFNGIINPADFGSSLMFKVIAAAIVGGVRTIWGPILGLFYLTMLEELFFSYADWVPLLWGVSVIGILIFAPNGLESIATSFLTRCRASITRLFDALT